MRMRTVCAVHGGRLACRSPWSPRWSSPRRPCCSCDPATRASLRCRWRREPISAGPARASPRLPAPAAVLSARALLVEGGVLVLLVPRARPRRLRRPGRRRPVAAGAAAARRCRSRSGVAPLPVQRDRARAGQGRRAGRPSPGRLGAATSPSPQAIGARVRRRRAARCWSAACAASAADWWMPGAAAVVAFGVDHHLRRPDRARPDLQPVQAAAGGRRRAATCSTLAKQAGRRRRRGLRDRRPRAHDRGQRLRQRARPHEARRALRQPAATTSRRDETRLVVAHELGHVRYRDVPRGLLYLAIVAPVRDVRRRAAWRSASPREDAPAAGRAARRCVLAVARRRVVITSISNQLSRARRGARRRVRARAHRRAGGVHRLPAADRAQERLATPTRRTGVTFLLGTHPPTVERIGQAEAAARASSREG